MDINIVTYQNAPDNLEWLRALVPVIISGVAAFISFVLLAVTWRFYAWQRRLGNEQLRHSLFEKRFSIYAKFRDLLFALGLGNDAEAKDRFQKAGIARLEGGFLLPVQIEEYLKGLYEHTKDAGIAHITYLEETNKAGASDPETNKDKVAHALSLSTERPKFLALVPELVRQFESVLKLSDFVR